MTEFTAGDRVRVLGLYGNQIGTGVVVSVSAKDRTHVRRLPGRAIYSVDLDDGQKLAMTRARLRRDTGEREGR